MENLNAEHIKRGLECCKGSYDCFTCDIYKRGCAGWRDGLAKDALALINSQEQRIKELTEDVVPKWEVDKARQEGYESGKRDNVYGFTAKELAQKVEKLSAENARLIENNKQIVTDAVRSVSRLTEEKEMLRGVKSEYETFIGELKPKIDTIRADTVRKMQERLKAKAKNNEWNGTICGEDIDQIAKEMLEGGNNND